MFKNLFVQKAFIIFFTPIVFSALLLLVFLSFGDNAKNMISKQISNKLAPELDIPKNTILYSTPNPIAYPIDYSVANPIPHSALHSADSNQAIDFGNFIQEGNLLVFFGFTSCMHICPMAMSKITKSIEIYEKNLFNNQDYRNSNSNSGGDFGNFDDSPRRNLGFTPIFISIDPEQDSLEIVKSFLSNYHNAFYGLTAQNLDGVANMLAIENLVNAFKLYAKKLADEEISSGYNIHHSSLIYLIKDGKIQKILTDDFTQEQIAQELKTQFVSVN